MTTIIKYQRRKIEAPDWPGDKMRGNMFARDIAGLGSIGYGRCSSNPKASQGIQDSADAQAGQYGEFCGYWGTANLGWLADPNSSAGVSAQKERENFTAAMEKVRTDRRVKIVWVMTSSRFSRGDTPFDDLVVPLIEHGVLFAVGGTLFNPAEEQDRQAMHEMYVADSGAPIAGKIASRKGKDKALSEGRPIGREPYGLVRDKNRKPVMDIPDTAPPGGQPAPDVPAEVVREIFRRVAAGEAGNAIALDFERRQILIPRAARGHQLRRVGAAKDEVGGPRRVYQWTGQTIRGIATNPVYIGMRRSVRLPEDVPANVEPLVSEDLFYAAQRAVEAARGTRQRWSPRNTMLSNAAFCGVCGMPLGSIGAIPAPVGQGSRGRRTSRMYACRQRGHASIREDYLDEYVSDRIVEWLADPLVAEQLAARREDDMGEIRQAEADADRLAVSIGKLGALADDPPADFDPVFANRQMAALKRQMADALERACPPSLDPDLATLLGPGAGSRWAGLTNVQRRKIIMMAARVTLRPVPAGEPRRWALGSRIAGRIGWEWKLRNPATGVLVEGGSATAAVAQAGAVAAYVPADDARAGRVYAWLAGQDGPRTVYEISDGIGEHVVSLWRALDVLLADGRVTKEHGNPNRHNRWFYRTRR